MNSKFKVSSSDKRAQRTAEPKIKRGEDHVALDVEISLSCQQALDGNRSANVEMWKAVARGEFDIEVHLWVQALAEKVLKADCVSAKLRAGAIMKATGLSNRDDDNALLFDEADNWAAFDDETDPEIQPKTLLQRKPATDAERRKRMIDYLDRTYPHKRDWRSWVDRQIRKRCK